MQLHVVCYGLLVLELVLRCFHHLTSGVHKVQRVRGREAPVLHALLTTSTASFIVVSLKNQHHMELVIPRSYEY